jgi:hypothetical protein
MSETCQVCVKGILSDFQMWGKLRKNYLKMPVYLEKHKNKIFFAPIVWLKTSAGNEHLHELRKASLGARAVALFFLTLRVISAVRLP